MPAQTTPLAKAPTRDVIGIKVKFTVESKDRRRRVVFGLEKATAGDQVTWKIDFELFERDNKNAEFGDPLVDLDVQIDTRLNARAEAVAQQGLTPGQAAHLIGPAAEDAKAAQQDELDPEEANQTIQATLRKK